jgi:hypothetical protein
MDCVSFIGHPLSFLKPYVLLKDIAVYRNNCGKPRLVVANGISVHVAFLLKSLYLFCTLIQNSENGMNCITSKWNFYNFSHATQKLQFLIARNLK